MTYGLILRVCVRVTKSPLKVQNGVSEADSPIKKVAKRSRQVVDSDDDDEEEAPAVVTKQQVSKDTGAQPHQWNQHWFWLACSHKHCSTVCGPGQHWVSHGCSGDYARTPLSP